MFPGIVGGISCPSNLSCAHQYPFNIGMRLHLKCKFIVICRTRLSTLIFKLEVTCGALSHTSENFYNQYFISRNKEKGLKDLHLKRQYNFYLIFLSGYCYPIIVFVEYEVKYPAKCIYEKLYIY